MAELRAAGIDAGTNSFLLLLLARDDDGRERVLLDRSDITRLGEGVDAARRLQPGPLARCLDQLAEYASLCAAHGVTTIRAVGTSALRDASNRAEFLDAVRARCGFELEVISGEREAELTYLAVAGDRATLGQPLWLLDIGGGSTELVRGIDGRLDLRTSLDIGAVRVTDRAGELADPPTPAQLAHMSALATAAVESLPTVDGPVIGTGGTITTLAAIHHGLSEYDAATVEATRLTPALVDELLARLASVPLAARRTIPGLPSKRADVILGGTLVLRALLARLGLAELGVSAGGLRFAVARLGLDSLVR